MRLSNKLIYIPIVVAIIISIGPIIYLLFGSLWSSNPGMEGSFTLKNYEHVFLNPDTPPIIFTSVIYSIGSSSLAVSIALILSFLIRRTDAPFRGITTYSLIATLAIPWMVEDMSWTYLMSPRTGLYNILAKSVLGSSQAPFNIYSLWGLIWAMGLSLTPLCYLIISSAISLIDPRLEEASMLCGASLRKTVIKIDLPLVKPAILSAFILGFIISMEAFDVAAIIGTPAGIWVLTNSIYRAIVGSVPPDYGLASTYAIILVAITLVAISIYTRYTMISNRYTTVTGQGGKPNLIRLGKWRWVAGLILLLYLFIYPIPIISMIFTVSLYSFWNPIQLPPPSLQNYIDFFNIGSFRLGLLNSITVSLTASALVVPFAVLIGYISLRKRGKFSSIAEMITSLPLAFPTIVLGVGLLWAFVYSPFPLYGTIWALSIAYIIRYTPLVTRFISGPLAQLHTELEETSRVCGANMVQTISRITVPILRSSIIASALYVFIVSMKDLGAAIMLVTRNSLVLSAAIFNTWSEGEFQIAVAGSVVFVAIITSALLIARFLLNINILSIIEPESRRASKIG